VDESTIPPAFAATSPNEVNVRSVVGGGVTIRKGGETRSSWLPWSWNWRGSGAHQEDSLGKQQATEPEVNPVVNPVDATGSAVGEGRTTAVSALAVQTESFTQLWVNYLNQRASGAAGGSGGTPEDVTPGGSPGKPPTPKGGLPVSAENDFRNNPQ